MEKIILKFNGLKVILEGNWKVWKIVKTPHENRKFREI